MPNVSSLTSSNSKSEAFWRKRLVRFGHTGWANPIVYAYDQLERRKFLESRICERQVNFALALDFGCGTGEFSDLLLQKGYNVCGYDPFVKPRIRSDKFTYASKYEQIPFQAQSVEMAIAVTTLDHILVEAELRAALEIILRNLRPGGHFLMLEYALDRASDREEFALKNDYQSFRTLSEWIKLLHETSLRVLEVEPVTHPLLNPSSGYIAYSRSLLVRLLRTQPRIPLKNIWLEPVLRWHAARFLQTPPGNININAIKPLKLIHCVAAP